MATGPLLSVGTRSDFKDEQHVWGIGIVIEIDSQNASRAKLEYLGRPQN